MRALVAVSLLAMASGAYAQTNQIVRSDFLTSPVQDAIALRFTGANEGFIIEKGGAFKRFENGAVSLAFTLPVATNSERGLLGIALDPSFAANQQVYLYYSAGSGSAWSENRLSRFTWNGTTLVGQTDLGSFGSSTDTQATGPNHNGGPLLFGPDGKLYGVTGDLNRSGIEQNSSTTTSARTGGVYRLEANGAIPGDNPFATNANTDLRRWYTYGVRNSFGIAVDPVSNRLWTTENGPDVYDEINLISSGMNSGWTDIMGPDGRDASSVADLVMLPGASYQDPKFSFQEPIGITAMHFLHGSNWGTQYDDAVLVGDVRGQVWLLRLNAGRDGFVLTGDAADLVLDPSDASLVPFGTGLGTITDFTRGPDGAVYMTALGADGISRITPVPEPAAWVLMTGALLLIGLAQRRSTLRIA